MFRLRRAAAALSYEAERVLAAAGLRLVEFAALAALVDRYEMSQAALGERIGLDRNGISKVLDDLEEEEEGLVARRPHATDGRRRVVEITAAGRSRLSAAVADLDAIESVFLSVLDESERDELRDILRRLEPPPPALGDLYRLGPPRPRRARDWGELDDWD